MRQLPRRRRRRGRLQPATAESRTRDARHQAGASDLVGVSAGRVDDVVHVRRLTACARTGAQGPVQRRRDVALNLIPPLKVRHPQPPQLVMALLVPLHRVGGEPVRQDHRDPSASHQPPSPLNGDSPSERRPLRSRDRCAVSCWSRCIASMSSLRPDVSGGVGSGVAGVGGGLGFLMPNSALNRPPRNPPCFCRCLPGMRLTSRALFLSIIGPLALRRASYRNPCACVTAGLPVPVVALAHRRGRAAALR